ncbi:RadC family protein [Gorillibacterium timonense]|uniref:RadC family protein n=1 Tax=Gorillibacterium timonense TaxID=1689269 RepID=UPI00071D27AA|nr:DNA repair protein RadC [Gorillibacterium timonense]
MDNLSAKHTTLREAPPDEQPREKMLDLGPDSLSNAELLAILLRTGTARETAVGLAGRILKESGSLGSLVEMSIEQLTTIKGIGPAKAVQIKAGIELGKRLARTSIRDEIIIRSPKDVADFLMEDMRYLQKEHFVCLFLNTKNRVIARETLSMGSLNASIVHPREVFLAAIKRSSASIICVHNHPSGDPTPSPEDIELTDRLKEAGDIIGIDVLDHIVLGDRTFVSLKEKGYL